MKQVLVAGILSLLIPVSALAAPLYRETFNLCSALDTSSKNAMDIAGWKAFKADSPVGKLGFLKVNAPGSPDHPLSYNSFPRGPEHGGAFWSKATDDLTIFTDEASFDVSNLAVVQYQQRLGGRDDIQKLSDGTQLGLLIGNTWYISDQVVRQNDPGVWETVSLAPAQLTYGTVPNVNGRGPKKPSNFNVKLPSSGIVTAFGVFVAEVHGRIRIDNFTLSDLSTESRDPGMQGSAEQCPFINPDDTIGDDVTAASGRFCSGRSARALGKVAVSKTQRTKLLLSVQGSSLEALRNRAILSLLVNNGLRIDNLVNVTVADYFSVGSIQLLNASGVVKQTKPVKPAVKRAIDEYLAASGLNRFGKLPLFQGIDKKTGKPNGAAMCTNGLASIVTRQAKKSGISVKFGS